MVFFSDENEDTNEKNNNETVLVETENDTDLRNTNLDVNEPLFLVDNKIQESIEAIIANQTKMFSCFTQEFAKLHIKIDKLNDKLNEMTVDKTTTNSQETTNYDILEHPINSLEELELLNGNLKEKVYWQALIKKMTRLCGKNGNGLDTSYMLIDLFFTRQF